MKHTVYHKKLILYFFYHINSIQNGIIMTSHQCQGYKEKTCKKSKRYGWFSRTWVQIVTWRVKIQNAFRKLFFCMKIK